MLKKLLKYDFRAMGRILGPIYLAMLGVSAVFGLTLRSWYDRPVPYALDTNLTTNIAGTIFVAAIFVGALVTLIMVIQSFYRNLLGDQGYLMFSLPVKARTLVTGKGLSSTIWVFLGGVCGVLCILLVVFISTLGDVIPAPHITASAGDVALFVLQGILFVLAGIACNVMKIYASIAVGHLWSEHRAMAAILAFIGFSIIGVVLLNPLDISSDNVFVNWVYSAQTLPELLAALHVMLLWFTIAALVIAAIYWVITSAILEKKLNLQ